MVQTALSEISPFLTEAVVNRAFRLRTGSQDDVKSIVITRAAPAGSGLLGALYRITVTGNTHTASFVVKAMVRDPLLKRTLQPEQFFEREAYFFSNVLPKLVENQKSCGAKNRIQDSIPIFYDYHCDGVNDFLLLEDLSESGCIAVSEHPTRPERDAVLRTLAHFHAVAIALKEKQPEQFSVIISSLSEVYYAEEKRNWYAGYLQNAIDFNLKALADYENPKTSVYYKKFFEVLTDDPYGQMIKLLNDKSAFVTLNHGDAWSPNFLCSEDRGAVVIDFQLLRSASPAADLSYLLILGSTDHNPKDFKRNVLEGIKLYHDALAYYLKDMNIDADKVFSREELHRELNKFGKFGVLAAVTTMILLMSERCDNMQSFEEKYGGMVTIPLEQLWPLRALEKEEEKMIIVNSVRTAVDVGFI